MILLLALFLADSPIQRDRLHATLEELSQFGRNPESGVSRLGFSEADLASRPYVTKPMTDAGLTMSLPSVAGISHAPKERSEWQDIANGAEVLYRAILKLDGQ